MMDKDQFIAQYIVSFLASFAAVNYRSFCVSGKHDWLTSESIAEEAEFLANEAWKSLPVGLKKNNDNS